ncbi:hypothetical protein [Mycoplasmopsis gallinacea]|uniref:Uncharacterized protein n=1 Tax=Mycoplasmopsis gallinacea TaxID=29556 RepID=A0A449A414_9BACT|nr:hypothetical protein [Mycoplasmopsis gallinacea]VEU58962.1 Uncharacterised protein [Mycoplasmopsis gallinacea]
MKKYQDQIIDYGIYRKLFIDDVKEYLMRVNKKSLFSSLTSKQRFEISSELTKLIKELESHKISNANLEANRNAYLKRKREYFFKLNGYKIIIIGLLGLICFILILTLVFLQTNLA